MYKSVNSRTILTTNTAAQLITSSNRCQVTTCTFNFLPSFTRNTAKPLMMIPATAKAIMPVASEGCGLMSRGMAADKTNPGAFRC